MKLVDVNVLLATVFEDHDHHLAARQWFERALTATETVALPWLVILGFVRISTHRRIYPTPLDGAGAMLHVGSWLSRPQVICPQPSRDHVRGLQSMLSGAENRGDLVNDAHLAVLALENRATVVSYDSDFGRFGGIRWRTPEQLLQEGQ